MDGQRKAVDGQRKAVAGQRKAVAGQRKAVEDQGKAGKDCYKFICVRQICPNITLAKTVALAPHLPV